MSPSETLFTICSSPSVPVMSFPVHQPSLTLLPKPSKQLVFLEISLPNKFLGTNASRRHFGWIWSGEFCTVTGFENTSLVTGYCINFLLAMWADERYLATRSLARQRILMVHGLFVAHLILLHDVRLAVNTTRWLWAICPKASAQ